MYTTLSLILASLVLFLYSINYYFYNTKAALIFKEVPGPKRLPVIGNISDFFYSQVPLFYQGRWLANTFNGLYGIQVFNIRAVNIIKPRDIEIILSSQKHITKSDLYHFLHPWLNEGLLTSSGEKWQKRRKILTPAFHFNVLRQFCNIFSEQSANIVQSLKQEIGKPETDIISFVAQFTINSICETAMGIQLELSENSVVQKYKDAIYKMGVLLVHRFVRIWLHATPIFKLTSVGKEYYRTIPVLHKFTLDVIRKRRATMLTEDNSATAEKIEDDDYMNGSKKRLAMLDLLLSAESQGKIDEQGIREEVDTFMFEGHDTTTMAITFCLMLLANHPIEQEKIVAELDDIFTDSKQAATMEDLNKMRYLEMCLKEALRLYPSVPFISRLLKEDVQLNEYFIPSGADCHIHIWDLHRDPTIYPAPDDFLPERFTQENSSKRHPFAYIPFSAGPRNCIGQKFAIYELKSVISTILRNFRLEPVTKPHQIIFSADLVLRCRDPIKVKILPRNT